MYACLAENICSKVCTTRAANIWLFFFLFRFVLWVERRKTPLSKTTFEWGVERNPFVIHHCHDIVRSAWRQLSIFRVNTIVGFRGHDVRIILLSYYHFNEKGNFVKIYVLSDHLRSTICFETSAKIQQWFSYVRMQFSRAEKVDDKVNFLSN